MPWWRVEDQGYVRLGRALIWPGLTVCKRPEVKSSCYDVYQPRSQHMKKTKRARLTCTQEHFLDPFHAIPSTSHHHTSSLPTLTRL